MTDQPLTAPQAAEIIGINVGTLYRWCRRGIVPHYRLPSGRLRFTREILEGFKRRAEARKDYARADQERSKIRP